MRVSEHAMSRHVARESTPSCTTGMVRRSPPLPHGPGLSSGALHGSCRTRFPGAVVLRGRAGDALGVSLPRSVLVPREAAALLVALVACRGDGTDAAPDAARPSLGVAPAASHPQIGARPPRPRVDEAALALAASATVRREPPSTFIVDAAARRALCDNRDGAFRQLRVLPESPDGGAAGRGPWCTSPLAPAETRVPSTSCGVSTPSPARAHPPSTLAD